MEWSVESKKAFSLVMQGESLFITGKAGTGKTTLLYEIRRQLTGKKVIAVLAPTGVAAENAGGFTIHSFLRLPLTPYLPKHKIDPLVRLSDETIKVIRSLDMIIIDEISMVRCDLLDEVDSALRHYRGSDKPFGGIQMVMFGDLFQLCPVATKKEEETLLEYYNTLYFFGCYALQELRYRVIELKHVYRQEKKDFISLLNNIREAKVDVNDLDTLDTRVDSDYYPAIDSDVVTLMTHRRMTNSRNAKMLEELEGEEKIYTGHYDEGWKGLFPVRRKLALKIGARVMFQRNDNVTKSYRNGTMGWVSEMQEDYVKVVKDNGQEIYVEPATWEQFEFHIDKENKIIRTEITATYTQIPLKLAWAVSIHKSQGLTFNEVCIDVEHAFTFGQVYVALSRCRTLEGIHLITPIMYQKIMADEIVKCYVRNLDAEGYVKDLGFLAKNDDSTDPLEIEIDNRRFWNIKEGKQRNYSLLIKNETSAKKIFTYDGERIIVNPIFANQKETWSYTDINGGNLPFVLKSFTKVRFMCENTTQSLLMHIDGIPNIELKLGFWEYSFRVGKLINMSI